MKRVTTFCILCGALLSLLAPKVYALGEFKTAFQKKYVEHGNDKLKATFKSTACNTCHIKDQKKSIRNPYGEELAKLVQGSADARLKDAEKQGGQTGRKAELEKLVKEVEKAFDEVAKLKNKDGVAFGELIEKGDLLGFSAK